METFVIKIEVLKGKYTYVSPDPRMPFMLADEIKRVVKEFYEKDDD